MTKVADLKACDAIGTPNGNVGAGGVPCKNKCASTVTDCFNHYLKGKNVFGGCELSGAKCGTGTTDTGATQACCVTDNCNTNLKAKLDAAAKPAAAMGAIFVAAMAALWL